MKNYINVQKLEDLKQNNVSCAELCQIPLLHGTRRYALQATKEEREKFYSACNIVMDFAKKIAYSDIITEESIPYSFELESRHTLVAKFARFPLEDYPAFSFWPEIVSVDGELYLQYVWDSDFYKITDEFETELIENGFID